MSIYLSGLINSYSHKIQNPGIDSTTPDFTFALFTKNKFLLTSFIVLFVYMSYFYKDCFILTFIGHFFQIGSGFDGTFGLCLFEIILSRVEVPLQQFQYASVVQRRTRLCIGLVQITYRLLQVTPLEFDSGSVYIRCWVIREHAHCHIEHFVKLVASLFVCLGNQRTFPASSTAGDGVLIICFCLFHIESANYITHCVIRVTQSRIAIL